MCGIFAYLTNEPSTAESFFQRLAHRGPDATFFGVVGEIEGQSLVFGFHRLAIVDPTERSMQPLVRDDLHLICNGEIYNYLALKKKYGLNLNTGSDCEVILALFDHFGRDEIALQRTIASLDGEFAFVLYDVQNHRLMAARDPYGVRPLFYGEAFGGIALASELKALAMGATAQPFPPAHYMYEGALTKWYDIPECKAIYPARRKICMLLHEAVEARLMGDRPIGCFLSGGLDSSIVTAMASKHIPNLECFTIGFEGSPDIAAAKEVVVHLRAQGRQIIHHVVNFTPEEGLAALEEVIWHLETYDITTIRASIPQYLLCKYITKNTKIKVLLSGEGSDEINASYLYFRLAPDYAALDADRRRLVSELYLFDNLRVDRTAAAFGLEVRVPFLSRDYVDFMFSIDPRELSCAEGKIEKALLRGAACLENLLPQSVLYRQKEAFSDAVSSPKISWFRSIQDHARGAQTSELSSSPSPSPSPATDEAQFYKKIFNELFPNRISILPHYWMPSWTNTDDPSATVLTCYTSKI